MSEYYIGFTSDHDPRSVAKHHGVLGQKWGQKNGPPYPLDASDHSASEKKAGWRKSLFGKKKTEEQLKEEDRAKAAAETAKLVNEYLDKNPKNASRLEELMTSQIYANRAWWSMMQDAWDESWSEDNPDLGDRKERNLEDIRQMTGERTNTASSAINSDKGLSKIPHKGFDVVNAVEDRVSKQLYEKAEENLKLAKNEGKWDMNFLEAIQNDESINRDRGKMLKEYAVYLYNPIAYWQKDLFEDPENLTYYKGSKSVK